MKSGTWKSNELIKTTKGDKVSYNANVITVPKVLRNIPQNQLDLIAMFRSSPFGASPDLTNIWQRVGPFDLQAFTNNGSYVFDENLITYHLENNDTYRG